MRITEAQLRRMVRRMINEAGANAAKAREQSLKSMPLPPKVAARPPEEGWQLWGVLERNDADKDPEAADPEVGTVAVQPPGSPDWARVGRDSHVRDFLEDACGMPFEAAMQYEDDFRQQGASASLRVYKSKEGIWHGVFGTYGR